MPPMPDSTALAALRRRIPTGLAGGVFWLALWFALLWLIRLTSLPGRTFFGWMEVLVGAALAALVFALLISLVRHHLLWRLRNKLIVTYVLIGLAPFVLFLTLVAISAYVAAGQFSIHLADSRLHQQLDQVGQENSARASSLARIFYGRGAQPFGPPSTRGGSPPRGPRAPFRRPQQRNVPGPPRPNRTTTPPAPQPAAPAQTPAQSAAQAAAAALGETPPNPLLARLRRHTAAYVDSAPLAAFLGLPSVPQQPVSSEPTAPLGLPPWAADLHGNQFRGLVLDGQDLFLVAIDQRHIEGSKLLTVVTSLPVNKDLMDVVADNLGRVHIRSIAAQRAALSAGQAGHTPGNADRTSIYGGEEPPPVYLCDFGVLFGSTLGVRDWDTGDPDNVPIDVHSRPSVLYRQLFGSSLSGFVTNSLRTGFITICILFALIEAIAFWAALRLSRQITASVEDLYSGTQRVDRGDLTQRIPALNTRDQLGELSVSFNRMTGSLERLLVEQQEKERLQNELTIAQEVQANLFPHHVHNLPTLELHGICRPARTVSGDYYDFFIFHDANGSGAAPARETGVGIALGDISGKGISAALLMATLHSAVRAYRLVSEDLAAGNDNSFAVLAPSRASHAAIAESATTSAAATAVLSENGSSIAADGAIFASPARILSLVNRHLYTSTQPEKYATLFLAHYDAATARLTYSNAGHLPPIVLGRDGSIRRLDRGGTVVGLLPGVHYQEGRVTLRSGDILIGYSDGITEPENDFGEFGEARLIETVARYRDQPLHVISAQVMLALDAWIGAAEQPDDITLVLARQI